MSKSRSKGIVKKDKESKKSSPILSLSFLLFSLSPSSLHIRPADFHALQLPNRLPQTLIDRAHGVHNRDSFAVFGPVGFRAVFAGEA